MSDGAKSWVGDTQTISLGQQWRIMALKSIPHPNLAGKFKQMNKNSRTCMWLLCWLCGSLCEGFPGLCLYNQNTSLPQGQIFHFHCQSDMFEDLVDFTYCLFFYPEPWTQDSFWGVFLDGEKLGPPVPTSEESELSSQGSVSSRPKAPQELLGTCEGLAV